MVTVGDRIRQVRQEQDVTQQELADYIGVSKQAVYKYENNIVTNIPTDKVDAIAKRLKVSPAYLMGWEEQPRPAERAQKPIPPGFRPLPEMVQVPLIGTIACGTPITAEQNVKSYIGIPAAWHADFALECHGDSMAPTICDGDVVCIRSQPEVEQGQIAAVRIGEEATLKHFYRQGDVVSLIADNPAVCPPMVFAGQELEEMAIEGLAVGYCRGLV